MTPQLNTPIVVEDTAETILQDVPMMDNIEAGNAALLEKLDDALTPGFQAEFDPDEAERAGAFQEDALSELDAAGSTDDQAEAQEEPAFLDDDGPSADIPTFVSTTNAGELYGLRPGETVSEALACRANGG